MLDNQKTFNADLNSLGTSTHETGTSLIALTGNPYIDLAAYGIDLHGCTIRYLRSTNQSGNTVTGRFNISGREETAGATSYETLILFLVRKNREHRRYAAECRKQKRERNMSSFISRYPEVPLHPDND